MKDACGMKRKTKNQNNIKKSSRLFAVAKKYLKAQAKDKDSDCWSDLWKRIKAQGVRIFRVKKKDGERREADRARERP